MVSLPPPPSSPPSSLRAASASALFLSCNARSFCSTVSAMLQRQMRTGRCCPKRWIRSMAEKKAEVGWLVLDLLRLDVNLGTFKPITHETRVLRDTLVLDGGVPPWIQHDGGRGNGKIQTDTAGLTHGKSQRISTCTGTLKSRHGRGRRRTATPENLHVQTQMRSQVQTQNVNANANA